MKTEKTILANLRREYHKNICREILGYRNGSGSKALSNADSSSNLSIALAKLVAEEIALPLCKKPPSGQAAGALFADFTRQFLEAAFTHLGHLRPGSWVFSTGQHRLGIAGYDQYAHIAELAAVVANNKELAASFGSEYFVTPDIVMGRRPIEDAEINRGSVIVPSDQSFAGLTSLRAKNFDEPKAILHATISCKWTMRSDRAQNTRTEALNLIRNRKGHTPHIVAVTCEPTAGRIASIALGTGDIDCTYHAALSELMHASKVLGNEAQTEMLNTLIGGKRLRDISDLPFDLAT